MHNIFLQDIMKQNKVKIQPFWEFLCRKSILKSLQKIKESFPNVILHNIKIAKYAKNIKLFLPF